MLTEFKFLSDYSVNKARAPSLGTFFRNALRLEITMIGVGN